MNFTKPLPAYRPSMRLGALEISHVVEADIGATIGFVDQSYCPITVNAEFIEKNKPEVGMFFVAYPGGLYGCWPDTVFKSEMEIDTDFVFHAPPSFNVFWYPTLDAAHRAVFAPIAAEAGDDYDDVLLCDSWQAEIAKIRTLGIFIASDVVSNSLHAWAADSASIEKTLNYLGLEVSRLAHGGKIAEIKTLEYGSVAATAYSVLALRSGGVKS